MLNFFGRHLFVVKAYGSQAFKSQLSDKIVEFLRFDD